MKTTNSNFIKVSTFLVLACSLTLVWSNACVEWPDGTGKCTLPLCDCSEVTELDLEGMDLTSISTWIGSFTNLKRLDVSNNQLSSLPTELGLLTHLNYLDLNSNQIACLPTELGLLTELRSLLLFKNEIKSIPTEIGNLFLLKKLSASNNQIDSLPTELGSLFNLETLEFRYNKVPIIPTEIGSLNLNKLDFRHNPYTCPLNNLEGPSSIYSNAINSINSSCNQLCIPNPCSSGSTCHLLDSWVDYGCTFQETGCDFWDIAQQYCTLPQCDCTNITTLDLSYRNLTTLPTWIGLFTELEYLYLSGNQLESLPTELGSLWKLKELFVNWNLLEGIPTEIANLWELIYFDIEYNPFVCPLPNDNSTSNYIYNDAINYINSVCLQEGFCDPDPCIDSDDQCTLLPDWTGSSCEETDDEK